MKLATDTKRSAPLQREKRQTAPLRSPSLLILLLSLLLLAAILLGVSFGSTPIPLGDVVQILLNGTQLFHFKGQWDASAALIIWQVRMPMVIGAVLVGTALAVAGVLFQGILRNPLADPFLIGTSSGASLGASIAFILPLDTIYGIYFPITSVLAFMGAIIAVLFVYTIARAGGRTPVVTLLLAGVVVNSVLIAFQTLILTLSPHYAQYGIQALFNWLSGGVTVISWLPILVVGLLVAIGLLCSLALAGVLDVFALGEEYAVHLGLHVERYKFIVIIIASLLTASAVSISGLIGFVGLVTPHVMRLILGPRHRLLLPASALGGAIFLTLADLLARVIPPSFPVGVFTALVGAPFFLYLLRSNKRSYQW